MRRTSRIMDGESVHNLQQLSLAFILLRAIATLLALARWGLTTHMCCMQDLI